MPSVSYLCCSVSQSCLTLCNSMDCSTPGLPVPHHLPEFAQVHVHCINDVIQPSHPLMPSFFLPLIFPSIKDFSNELALHINWPKYWSFSFSISLSNEYSGLIFFKIGWFELLAAQGTQESSLEPQLKGINSLALYILYGPALTTVHDHEEAQSLDYTDLCWQTDVSAFQHCLDLS